MKIKARNITTIFITAALVLSLSIAGLLLPDKEISGSERRKLKQLPSLNWNTLLSGSFMKNFEDYSLDQFPGRDSFRRLKAFCRFNIFGQKDNNGIYIENGYAAKLEYPLNEDSLNKALGKLRYLYEKYFEGTDANIYAAVVPDKGYFLADKNGYPTMDYNKLFSVFSQRLDFANVIDLTKVLDIEDYYKTDTHWRQEKINEAARLIAEKMGSGADFSGKYTIEKAPITFYGVYYGQSALPLKGEELYYLRNDTIDGCTVYNYETDAVKGIYDMDKLKGKDPYEMFLSGSAALLKITNPTAATNKTLTVFRDSFASSLVPLLAECYSEITLVDIRYVASDYIEKVCELKSDDVLFLYSTLILNDSYTLK